MNKGSLVHEDYFDLFKINNINYNKISGFVSVRESIMEEVINAGLNPFYGEEFRLTKADVHSFITRVISIKRCLYDAIAPNIGPI